MTDPTARALRLLTLLQTHRFWSGPDLAERLEVSERTLRRDVDRLRELGYRVAAHPGAYGGYQLESGDNLPPLLINDDEAVAIAVGLRTAAVQGVGDGEHTSLSAMAKLEQVLPRNLRRRVSALQQYTIPAVRADAQVQADVLATLALGCRDHERLRFGYTSAHGVQSRRLVEPHSLVPRERRWYLIAWDVDRDDWRTFRIDRLADLAPTGVRVAPRELSPQAAAELVTVSVGSGPQRFNATVRMRATMEQVLSYFGVWASGSSAGPDGTVDWPIGGSSIHEMLMALLWIPPDYSWTLICDDEVAEFARQFSERLAAAV
ncbi:helix-turn-helix transcriptional regulator [Microlunatus soli]|uniref:Predicted DNA-binding transcriptional regulator YafY, contains an HTH and WYL domains n=1 Tax=Microlunatus soli TaxID=630515 RepID=A0A1H1V9C1_9ACTN|nr:YafY family protein [Microlunatus soli]SDS81342.1 Predicted DNA-binding transcriptional regulator YafY, contains an HTH and WYL domains [Microlunatus soli]